METFWRDPAHLPRWCGHPARAGSSNILHVVANKKAFRSRAISPRGGQGLYIEGPYDGQLSARGETIVLSDDKGRVVSTNLYQGSPSGPQQYLRITEIMYHPPTPPAGSVYEAEDFEYIELRNTGPTNINLTGVRFVRGIDFNFTGSAVTDLAPGGYVLIVRNLAAFTSRYGAIANIAGQYSGILNNSGKHSARRLGRGKDSRLQLQQFLVSDHGRPWRLTGHRRRECRLAQLGFESRLAPERVRLRFTVAKRSHAGRGFSTGRDQRDPDSHGSAAGGRD
ncbi:MAG: lamin tail domain-containing protein [Verrucomicrobia bacterium]|nr:lamin tail domain-containing protein [Verrucomicrobiota bacterium]